MTANGAYYALSDMQRYGLYWEERIARRLTDMGFHAHLPPQFQKPVVDIVVNSCLICSVKAARPKRHKPSFKAKARIRYQFNLSKIWKAIQHDPDILIILVCDEIAINRYTTFVIPARAIQGKTVSITRVDPRKYSGKYAKFCEAWDQVPSLASKVQARWEKANGQTELWNFISQSNS